MRAASGLMAPGQRPDGPGLLYILAIVANVVSDAHWQRHLERARPFRGLPS